MHPSRSGPPLLVGLAMVGVWCVTLVATGSPAADVFAWCAAVVAAVLAPGLVLVRLTRRAVAPLVEDLAWAVPAGCVVAMVGWAIDRLLPFPVGAYGCGPVLVVVALTVPAARRRVLARPAPGWGLRPTLVLAAVQGVALCWMLETGLLAYRPDPGVHGTTYYPDLMYNLSLVGQLSHHLVPGYPAVAGATLSYHWFLFAITSLLTTRSGVPAFDATLRLGPACLVPATLLLVAVVARRLSGRVWAGPLAAALLGAVELSQATRWTTEDGSLGILPRAWFTSTPQALGWVAGLAAAGTAVAFVRRAPEDRAVPSLLLVPFLALAAGSKSPELVVVGAGLGLALVVHVVRRDWRLAGRSAVGVALALGVFGAATLTIYKASSYGLQLRVFGAILDRVAPMFPGYATHLRLSRMDGLRYSRVALLAGLLLWVLPLLPRLAGLIFSVRYRAADSGTWICVGASGAGFLLALVLRHPAGSEVYFMQSAYPIGVAGAAGGLLLAWERLQASYPSPVWQRRLPVLAGLLLGAGLLGAAAIAFAQPHVDPVAAWNLAHPGQLIADHLPVRRLAWLWLRPLAWLGGLAVLGGLSTALLLSRLAVPDRAHPRPPVFLASALCLTLGAGTFTMASTFGGTVLPVQGSATAVNADDEGLIDEGALPTMRDAFAAGAYVNAHAGADDVVATNEYCRFSLQSRAARLAPCDARNFVVAALTERQTLVAGWAYSDRAVTAAWSQSNRRYDNEKFWNRQLLNAEIRAIRTPTLAGLDLLYTRHHVRWIMADLRDGPVNVRRLDRLAVARYVGSSTEVWQLRGPIAG